MKILQSLSWWIYGCLSFGLGINVGLEIGEVDWFGIKLCKIRWNFRGVGHGGFLTKLRQNFSINVIRKLRFLGSGNKLRSARFHIKGAQNFGFVGDNKHPSYAPGLRFSYETWMNWKIFLNFIWMSVFLSVFK